MVRSGLLATAALAGVALFAASPATPERAKVGKKPAFKFEQPLTNGLGATSLESFRGTPALFEFWGTY